MPRDYVNEARALRTLLKVKPSAGQGPFLTGEQRSSCHGRGMETRFSALIYLMRQLFRLGKVQFIWCSPGIFR